jgi:hypothetical protein
LLQHLICGGSGQGLTGVKYPDAVLFRQRTCAADWPKGNLVPGTLHFQGVAGFQVQFLTERLWDHHTTGFIDDKACVHSGTIPWVNPRINTILQHPSGLTASG